MRTAPDLKRSETNVRVDKNEQTRDYIHRGGGDIDRGRERERERERGRGREREKEREGE